MKVMDKYVPMLAIFESSVDHDHDIVQEGDGHVRAALHHTRVFY
jgi:hypothetical protein